MAIRVASLFCLIVLVASTIAAPVPKGEKSKAEKLVGRWEMMGDDGKAQAARVFVVFNQDGTMTLEVGTGDSVEKYAGKYKVVENIVEYNFATGDAKGIHKLDIKSLTEEELKATEKGNTVEYKRVKEKKD